MITLFNFFTGLRFHYFVNFEIWASGSLKFKGTRVFFVKNRKYMAETDEIKSAIILTEDQSDYMKLYGGDLLITGISYLGYFKK